MKKILFINGTNNIGGGELSLLTIASHIQNSSVMVFSNGTYTNLLKEKGIDTILLPEGEALLEIKREHGLIGILSKLKFLLLSIIELRKKTNQYDLIYCNSQKAILLGLSATFFTRKKIVIHVRDMMTNPNISGFQKNIFKLLIFLKKPTIIANSNATKQAMINIGIKEKIHVVYNGINLPKSLNIQKTNDKFVVAMFSRISHWKGQEFFVKAVNLLKREKEIDLQKFEFWIVGDAVMGSEEEKYKNTIIKMIEQYGLRETISLFGFVSNPLEYMKDIDILVLPSIYPEPFGRVVVEAMLLKKVVIATNMGGVTEIIDNNETGILVDTTDLANNIKNTIMTLYQDKVLYKKLSTQGYEKAKDSFSEEKMINQIQNILESLNS